MGRGLTFLAVVVGWVYFRADSVGAANSILKSMFGVQGLSLPSSLEARVTGLSEKIPFLDFQFNGLFSNEIIPGVAPALIWIGLLFIIAMFMPNTHQIMREEKPVLDTYYGDKTPPPKHRLWRVKWQPNIFWVLIATVIATASLLMMSRVSEFLYFQF